MNNDQFRRLIASGTKKSDENDSKGSQDRRGQASLGSRHRSSIPMTPRTIKGSSGVDFARQAAQNRASDSQKPAKQFRTVAPRGSKLAEGYQDRTQERIDEDADENAKKIQALEKQLKDEEIDQETFERMRDEITGGDISKTHLVKGLDWKLLERIRKGEDVNAPVAENEAISKTGDVDDEFESLERQEVIQIHQQKQDKKGQKADPLRAAGAKKTRDEILAELKASRKRAAEDASATQAQLSSKFRKIGDTKEPAKADSGDKHRKGNKTNRANGHKSRKDHIPPAVTEQVEPAMNAKILGADVAIPEYSAPPEESDDDIYADIGDDYDPLGAQDDSDPASGDEPDTKQIDKTTEAKSKNELPPANAPKKNYFNDDTASLSVLDNMVNPMKDPAYLAALAQKAKDQAHSEDPPLTEEEQRLKRRAEMLSAKDRDLDDLDMGFGASRHDDAEEMDMEGSKVKLSKWKGSGNYDDDDEPDGKGGKKRKRGPKKRKGDKESAADVLQAMERRKG